MLYSFPTRHIMTYINIHRRMLPSSFVFLSFLQVQLFRRRKGWSELGKVWFEFSQAEDKKCHQEITWSSQGFHSDRQPSQQTCVRGLYTVGVASHGPKEKGVGVGRGDTRKSSSCKTKSRVFMCLAKCVGMIYTWQGWLTKDGSEKENTISHTSLPG